MEVLTYSEFGSGQETALRLLGPNNAAYIAPELIFGQDKAIGEIREFVNTPDGEGPRVAILEGRFGTGKTSTVCAAMGGRALSFLTINDGEFSQPVTDSSLLLVEEMGRADPEHVAAGLQKVGDLLRNGVLKKVIINGDDTLKDPRFFEAIGVVSEDVVSIDFNPLTPDMFKEILRLRLNYSHIKHDISEIVRRGGTDIRQIVARLTELDSAPERYDGAAMNAIFDDEFLRLAIPTTERPVAEVRALLGEIREITAHGAPNDPARINGDVYARTTDQRNNANYLIEFICQRIRDWNAGGQEGPFKGFQYEELEDAANAASLRILRGAEIARLLRDPYFVLRRFRVSDFDSEEEKVKNALYIPDSNVFLDAVYRNPQVS